MIFQLSNCKRLPEAITPWRCPFSSRRNGTGEGDRANGTSTTSHKMWGGSLQQSIDVYMYILLYIYIYTYVYICVCVFQFLGDFSFFFPIEGSIYGSNIFLKHGLVFTQDQKTTRIGWIHQPKTDWRYLKHASRLTDWVYGVSSFWQGTYDLYILYHLISISWKIDDLIYLISELPGEIAWGDVNSGYHNKRFFGFACSKPHCFGGSYLCFCWVPLIHGRSSFFQT